MADNTFLPAYLTVGDDALKRQAVEARLVKRISALGDLSFNSDTFDGEKASGSAIVDACNTMPFASEVRLVTVRNADKLKKADWQPIVDYLKSPNATTVLALYAVSLSKASGLYKAIAALGKNAIIDCSSPKAKDLPALVAGIAKGYGLTLTRGAIELLIEYVGTDTVALDGELKKISLSHRGDDAVNEAEISLMVAHTAEIKPWEFVNALSANNKRRCIYCLNHMESASPYALLSSCVSRIRELLITQSLMRRHAVASLPDVLGMPAWKVKNHQQWARNFTPAKLRGALVSARDTEQAMKSGAADPDLAFQTWVLEFLS
ncbi:MAG: DNA polymerase III subunit delta [Eggerthellales bacterium]|nr:DNA polymerase III subunit delta [Eggerthellales bacterium]